MVCIDFLVLLCQAQWQRAQHDLHVRTLSPHALLERHLGLRIDMQPLGLLLQLLFPCVQIPPALLLERSVMGINC